MSDDSKRPPLSHASGTRVTDNLNIETDGSCHEYRSCNEILQTTGSIQLKANFPNKSNQLWPGQLVNARLLVDTRHNGLTVPAAVVQQGTKGVPPDG